MSLSVRPLTPDDREAYAELSASRQEHLPSATLAWSDLLQRILPGAENRTLLACESGRPAAALPLFHLPSPDGGVLNSLPFFGSVGGILLASWARDPQRLGAVLLDASVRLADELGVIASTLVANPLDDREPLYRDHAQATHHDRRIGQFTFLPRPGGGDLEEALMALYHQKARNMVRKALKSGVKTDEDDSEAALVDLAALHAENIGAKGGLVKPWPVFAALRDCLPWDTGHKLYVARLDGEVIAGLLVVFGNATVEYFTPATRVGFRDLQPMSLLVFQAMREAAARGFRIWNWGGTWLSQEGVHRFKARLGGQDRPYTYHVRLRQSAVLERTPAELLAAYPSFYVVPFSALASRTDGTNAARGTAEPKDGRACPAGAGAGGSR